MSLANTNPIMCPNVMTTVAQMSLELSLTNTNLNCSWKTYMHVGVCVSWLEIIDSLQLDAVRKLSREAVEYIYI